MLFKNPNYEIFIKKRGVAFMSHSSADLSNGQERGAQ